MTTAREETTRLADLLRREHRALAAFLIALSAFDRARRWRDLGYTGLFPFLVRELGLSEGAAFYRKTAVELIQRVPEVVEPLGDGRLCFSSIVELAKSLTPENRAEVLPRFFHVSKREAKAITAELRPAAVVPQRTVVTAARPAPVAVAAPPELHPDEVAHAKLESPPQQGPLLCSAPPRMTVEPKTAEESRLHLTVARSLLCKLAQARDALSHSHPGATPDQILEVGLDLILERQAKRRGLVRKPRKVAQEAQAPAVRSRSRPPAAAFARGGAATSPRTCAAPYGSGTAAAANSPSRAAACAAPRTRSSSTTSRAGRRAPERPSTSFASSATTTRTSPHASCTGTRS